MPYFFILIMKITLISIPLFLLLGATSYIEYESSDSYKEQSFEVSQPVESVDDTFTSSKLDKMVEAKLPSGLALPSFMESD